MTAISPQDHADQEDGRALRELREALPDDLTVDLGFHPDSGQWFVNSVTRDFGDVWMHHAHYTLAAAADACRAALRERAA